MVKKDKMAFFQKRLGRLFTFHLIIDIHTLPVTRNIVRPLTVQGKLNIASTELCAVFPEYGQNPLFWP